MMRHILASLLLLCSLPQFSSAQGSLRLVSLQTEVWGNTNAPYIQATGIVENTSAQSLEVKVIAQELSVVPGTLNYYCWERCYEPGVLLSPTSLTIGANQQVSNFYGDYVPQGQSGTSVMKYCFFNVANENDSVCGIIRFSANPVGVGELSGNSRIGISRAFPNPAVNDLSIDYNVGDGVGRIDIYSMLGMKVKSVNLPNQQGRLQLSVAGLPAGMYLYRLLVNGQDVQTKRFNIVR